MNHDDMPDLLPGYALDALDAAERKQVAQHVGLCPQCQIADEGNKAVVMQIAFAAPQRRPSAHVKARLMERLSHDSMPASAADPPSRELGRQWSGVRVPNWLLAVAVVPWLMLIGLAAMVMTAPSRTAPPRILAATIHGPHGENGRLAMVPGATTAILTLTGLPRPAAGKSLVCWLKRGGTMEYAAAFTTMPRSDDAYVTLHTRLPLDSYSAVGITMESQRRPARPTGTLLATGTL